MSTAEGTARRAHRRLVQALRDQEQAEKTAVLRFANIYHGGYFRLLGFSSIYHYATKELGFSKSRTAQFLRLAKDIDRLPELGRALQNDEIPWTSARAVSRIANDKNVKKWIDQARKVPRRRLEQQVKKARQARPAAKQTSLLDPPDTPDADPPVRFGFDLLPTQAAEVRSLMERVKPGRDRAQLFLDALAALVAAEQKEEENCTRVQPPPVQVVAYRCTDCEATHVITQNDMKRVTPAAGNALNCDAQRLEPDGSTRSTVPPKLRREVLGRDRHRCTECGRRWALHVHHKVPRSRGGADSADNCVTLCAPCHRVHHEREEATARPGDPETRNGAREPRAPLSVWNRWRASPSSRRSAGRHP